MSPSEIDEEAVCARASRLLGRGEAAAAYDLVRETLPGSEASLRLRQVRARALLELGAAEECVKLLEQMRAEAPNDEETLGLLASQQKRWALQEESSERRQAAIDRARELYEEAHAQTDASTYWPAINAATLGILAGDAARARELADVVEERCRVLLAGGSPEEQKYWILAALAEAALVRGEREEAVQRYAAARAEVGRAWSNLSTTRRNARLLTECLGLDWQDFDEALDLPSVAICAGHMLDRPDRVEPRFPPALAKEVEERLRVGIQQQNVGIGFASAACGTDILFLEAMQAAGREYDVLLPYEREAFVRDSVDIAEGGWRERFEAVLSSARSVKLATRYRFAWNDLCYEFCNEYLYGLAQMKASQLGARFVKMAVWDGEPGDGPGGTASMVEQWESTDHGTDVQIRPRDLPGWLAASAAVGSKREETTQDEDGADPASTATPDARIAFLLFADAVGFSRFDEEQNLAFNLHFMTPAAGIAKRAGHDRLVEGTAGDSLFLVYESEADAANVALELIKMARETSWEEHGLPRDLNLRVALHAAPVLLVTDPLTGSRQAVGAQVSQAQRMEPVTPPGHVYATESFAAYATARGIEDVRFQYVGITELAKGHGRSPAYHVRRHVGPLP